MKAECIHQCDCYILFVTEPTAAPTNIHASSQGITSLTVAWDAVNIFYKNGDVKGYQYVLQTAYID